MAQVRVVVYDSRLESFFLPGGMVERKVRDATNETSRLAKAMAPKRTGNMARSISADTRKLAGMNTVGRVRIRASYGSYVHEGTTGPITGSGRYLALPAYGAKPAIRVRSVSGQDANPFAERALRVVMVGL